MGPLTANQRAVFFATANPRRPQLPQIWPTPVFKGLTSKLHEHVFLDLDAKSVTIFDLGDHQGDPIAEKDDGIVKVEDQRLQKSRKLVERLIDSDRWSFEFLFFRLTRSF